MKTITKKLLSAFLSVTMLFLSTSVAIPTFAAEENGNGKMTLEGSEIPLLLRYDESASHDTAGVFEDLEYCQSSGEGYLLSNVNDDWERWSLPLGNGYFGVNVFGRTDTERLTVADKTLANSYSSWYNSLGGLNTFSETYIDFGHPEKAVTNYERTLDIGNAVSGVTYKYNGVTYTREYFTSYPDKALVIRLDASQAGGLSFTLRPTIPYEQDKAYNETFTASDPNNTASKTGTVTSKVENGVGCIELAGTMGQYGLDFVGYYRVYTDGTGTVSAGTVANSHKNSDGSTVSDIDGTITVSGAKSAYIVLTLGSDYELSSEIFSTSAAEKPTHKTTLADAKVKVGGYLSAITDQLAGKSFEEGYATLKENHLNDYRELFGRVSLNLDCDTADMEKTTDQLLADYKAGKISTYLEVLYFQYGRYLLIASSRSGALPAHLQGTWNKYNYAPWSAGYWHNINVQMNYWPAFSTNLAETFESYVDYNAAYMQQAEKNADRVISSYANSEYGKDGGNGWVIGTGGKPYQIDSDRSAGNLGFTTQLFWDYYAFTQDKTILNETVYPVLANAARYITKCVKPDADGHYLVDYCDSPEQYVNGVWYYTKGTTYAQTFAYLNNYNTLLAAKDAGIDLNNSALLSTEEYSILKTVMEQIDKYDPIIVGLSGQIKEFREEEYYGDLGEKQHRHISNLVGLYPGNLISSDTPAWLDAAKYTLTERGDNATGWGVAHRLNLWARTKDGNRAYDLVRQILKKNTATNLWDLHPPFQIDGNLGGTSGIAEMLLQSHEEAIAPLAAIPDAWANGSYVGLRARGDFTVDVAWNNGTASVIRITSGSGNEAKISLAGIGSAVVTDAEGKTVSVNRLSDSLISFNTEKGGVYTITGFTSVKKVAPVSHLSAVRNGMSPVNMTWNASPDAVSYNVYVAYGSAPAYTLLANVTETAYSFSQDYAELVDRATLAVTAVNADGTESTRALAYLEPEDLEARVNDVGASVLENGELQVTVNASESALNYRLYMKESGASSWTLLQESGFPILFEEGYDSSAKYAVSVINGYDMSESEKVTITDFSAGGIPSYNAGNILEGKTFVPSETSAKWVHMASYDYTCLTDGIYADANGRFSTKTRDDSVFEGTVLLNGTYMLSELRIMPFQGKTEYAGSSLKIELYANGSWTTFYEGTNADLAAFRTNASPYAVLSFPMNGIRAERIRISAPSPVSGRSISFHEITCSGIFLPAETKNYVNTENVFEGKVFTAGPAMSGWQTTYGPLSALTDGSYHPMNSDGTPCTSEHYKERVWLKSADACLDLMMELGSPAILDTLKMYDYNCWDSYANFAGSHIVIKVRNNGAWKVVGEYHLVCGPGNNVPLLYRKNQNVTDPIKNKWLEFKLGDVAADAIEIIVDEPFAVSDNIIGYYEIECTGQIEDPRSLGEARDIFAGRTFTAGPASTAFSGGTATSYAALTDGVYAPMENGKHTTSGYFERRIQLQGDDPCLDAIMDLGALTYIEELRLYDYGTGDKASAGSGQHIVIKVYKEGAWTVAKDIRLVSGNDGNFGEYRRVVGAIDPVKNQWLAIPMNNIAAEQIEIIITEPFTDVGGNRRIIYYEFEGTGRVASTEDPASNVLLGLTDIEATDVEHQSGNYPFRYAFDGDLTTRFATGAHSSKFSITANLASESELYTLKITDWRNGGERVGGQKTTRSDKTSVEVYVKGQWVKLVDEQPLDPNANFTSFNLYGIVGSKIRITFENTQVFDNGDNKVPATILEISCTTGSHTVDKHALLDAYRALPALEDGCSDEQKAAYSAMTAKFLSYLKDIKAGEAKVAAYTEEILAYAAVADCHVWGSWINVSDPTPTAKGVQKCYCVNDGAEKSRDTVYVTEDKILVSDPLSADALQGKLLVTIGDSITWGSGANDTAYGYYLQEILGVTNRNLGIGGTVICERTDRQVNRTLTAEKIKGADIVTIMLGANDWDSATATTSALGTYGSTDPANFYGAIRTWCETITALKATSEFANTQFYFMTPVICGLNRSVSQGISFDPTATNIHGVTFRDYCNAILEVCADYNIPVIDMNLYSGLYYNSATDNNVHLFVDGIHPGTEGQKLIAKSLAKELLNNYSYQKASAKAPTLHVNLTLRANMQYNIYLDKADADALSKAAYVIGGVEYPLDFVSYNDKYSVASITDIAPANLGVTFSVELTVNGETFVWEDLSVLDYARRIIGSADEKYASDKVAVASMVEYARAAAARAGEVPAALASFDTSCAKTGTTVCAAGNTAALAPIFESIDFVSGEKAGFRFVAKEGVGEVTFMYGANSLTYDFSEDNTAVLALRAEWLNFPVIVIAGNGAGSVSIGNIENAALANAIANYASAMGYIHAEP